jgi:hypothetical protein
MLRLIVWAIAAFLIMRVIRLVSNMLRSTGGKRSGSSVHGGNTQETDNDKPYCDTDVVDADFEDISKP